MKFHSSDGALRRGFTLIELLLVIGIIAILASIVIVAINPTKQLGDARNAQRRADVNTILNAVYQFSIDHGGALPGGDSDPTMQITSVAKQICQTGVDDTTGPTVACGVNLKNLSGAYVVAIPKDPSIIATGTGTRYSIVKDAATNRITVTAMTTDRAVPISVTR